MPDIGACLTSGAGLTSGAIMAWTCAPWAPHGAPWAPHGDPWAPRGPMGPLGPGPGTIGLGQGPGTIGPQGPGPLDRAQGPGPLDQGPGPGTIGRGPGPKVFHWKAKCGNPGKLSIDSFNVRFHALRTDCATVQAMVPISSQQAKVLSNRRCNTIVKDTSPPEVSGQTAQPCGVSINTVRCSRSVHCKGF